MKGTPTRTRFLIVWNGITGRDEASGSRLKIIKAKERGTLVMVLTKFDFERIAGGDHPERIMGREIL